MAILGSIANFNSHQYYFRLYGKLSQSVGPMQLHIHVSLQVIAQCAHTHNQQLRMCVYKYYKA
jgi:hypothetical protein